MSITREELDASSSGVQVICYHTANKPPKLFHVGMPDKSKVIWFWGAEEFKDFTNWPERDQEIYDIYHARFIPLHTGATYPKCAMNPYFITKPVALAESDCFELANQIKQLNETVVHLPRFIPTWLREPEPEPPRRLTPLRFLDETDELDGTRKRKREDVLEFGSEEWYAIMDTRIEDHVRELGNNFGSKRARSARTQRKYGKTSAKRT